MIIMTISSFLIENDLNMFSHFRALVVFGLNALAGRNIQIDGSAAGAWDTSNAESFIRYTVEKGYAIHGWELGIANSLAI